MIRVYFNSKADAPLVWSFDYGDISSERNITSITLDCEMVTNTDLEAVWPHPKAWLEIDPASVFVSIQDDQLVIVRKI